MKIVRNICLLAVSALLATACNNDDAGNAPAGSFPSDGVIRVTANVDEPATRVGYTTDALSKFFLRIENPNNQNYSYSVRMIRPDKQVDWTCVDSLGNPFTMLWQNNTQPVTVTAYYGIIKDLNALAQWKQEMQVYITNEQGLYVTAQACDFLYMPPTTVDPQKDLVDGKIKITLKHRFCKLNIKLNLGTVFNFLTGGTTINPVENIEVNNTKIAGFINLDSDVLTLLDNSSRSITPYFNLDQYKAGSGTTAHAEAYYECILLPQTLESGKFSVRFTIGNARYKWTYREPITFNKGEQYQLNLNVGKDAVTVGTFTGSPWTAGNGEGENVGTDVGGKRIIKKTIQ